MASTYSTNLAIELIGTGDQAGSWGNTTNTNLGTLIEQAISGYVTQAVSTGTDTTITIPNGATGVARNMYIELTGTGGASTNLIVPANKKLYFIFNNTTGAVTVKVSGQTGVSVPQGKKVVLTSNGTDIVNGLNYIADFGSNSATITQLTATSATITNLTLTSLVISNLSIASANITTLTSASATITNLINTSASITTITNSPTFSAGTANGVTYLNGSKELTSGSALQFSGTNLSLGAAVTSSTWGQFVGVQATYPGFVFSSTAGGGKKWSIGADAAVLTFRNETDSTTAAVIDGSNNVGIGTSSPTNKLEVATTTTNAGITIYNSNGSGGLNARLGFKSLNGYDASSVLAAVTAVPTSSSNTATALTFATSGDNSVASAGLTERMRLDASGNLGVGLTSPGRRLSVSATSPHIQLCNSTTGTSAGDGFELAVSNSDAYIIQRENAPMLFYTNDTERARITAGGSLLHGTNSDYTIGGNIFLNASTTNCIFANTTSAAGTGYLLFQGRSGAANVNVSGNVVFSVYDSGNVANTNNSYGGLSDERLKQDIVDATSQWDDIKGLRVRKFRYKAAPAAPLQIGLIAQEAETVSPGLVEEIFDQEEVEVVDESGNVKKEARIAETSTKSVKYSVLYMKAVKALQEAMSRIESLEAKVAALEAK